MQGTERGKGQQGSWKTVQPAVSARCFLENLLFLLLRSSSSGLRMASFREQPRLLTVFHARIFLPSFCLPPSFFLFWNYRPLTPTLSSSGDKINLTESSYADESVNLQGLPKVQKFDEFFGKKLVKTFKTLLVLDTRAVNKINPLD